MSSKENLIAYYASKSREELLQELNSSQKGLTHSEANHRIQQFGKNVLVEEKKENLIVDLLKNFKNPLIIILLIASFASAIFGENIDAVIIITMVILSVVLNFIQEYSASKAAKKLKEKIQTTTTLFRDGQETEVKITDVVVGDILILNAGDLIPADARVVESNDFFVNQSSLTGESFPAEKTPETIDSSALSLSDLTNIIFTGSNVETGTAKALVVKTGKDTVFGKIAKAITKPADESGYVKGVNGFSYIIMKVTIVIVCLVFFINAFLKQDVLQAFLFSIAVAVGLTPELLPVIMSINMARGSVQMAKKGVIVKKLTAIPNFGSMDILCTDKTGTLTKDQIELVKYTDLEGNDSQKVLLHAYLNSINQTGIKNPMDDAVIKFKHLDISKYKKVDEIPFDFVRKKMTVVVESNNERFLITKGAPEEVFKQSNSYEKNGQLIQIDESARKKITSVYHNMSSEGYRVLAVAIKKVDHNKKIYSREDEKELELIGFISFFDPAKSDVKDTLTQLHKMGLEIKVITGDNELVTQKICKDVELNVKGILLGHQIDSLTDDALRIVVENTTIFARFSPDEKNRIINALKQNGHVVGYMGDGINDAPSLKNADVGISVNNAVDVARESAKIILTHKSLRELREGVLEGRKTFGNTLKYIKMGISSNFGNMFSVIGAVLFLPYLPMMPIQILLNNLLYDFSQVTIPTDNVDKEYIQKPKRWDMNFIKHFMYVFGTVSSIFDFLTFFILYKMYNASASVFQTGWFLESLATQTLVIYIIRTKKTPFLESRPGKYLLLTTIICLSIGFYISISPLGQVFGFSKLPTEIYIILAIILLLYLLTVEITKRIFYHFYKTEAGY